MEGDFIVKELNIFPNGFQSTPSAWRVTRLHVIISFSSLFQSTPSAWRVTQSGNAGHRLRVISIHTLRMEGDLKNGVVQYYLDPFQSTPSAWRVTPKLSASLPISRFQSTPSAWRVTVWVYTPCSPVSISIHTLRMEGDEVTRPYSTPIGISIHTLRMEGDFVIR